MMSTMDRRAYAAHIAWLRCRAEAKLASGDPAEKYWHREGKFVVKSRMTEYGHRVWIINHPCGTTVNVALTAAKCMRTLSENLQTQYLEYLNEIWKLDD